MKRLAWVVLLAFVSCTTTLTKLENAQASLESHRAKYNRSCCMTMGPTGCANIVTTPVCERYGHAINDLSHAIEVAAPALEGGQVPKSAIVALEKATKAAEAAATP